MSDKVKVAYTDENGSRCSEWVDVDLVGDRIQQLEDAGATEIIHEMNMEEWLSTMMPPGRGDIE